MSHFRRIKLSESCYLNTTRRHTVMICSR